MTLLPSSSKAISSNSACATPWAMPPWTWPSTSIGFAIRPASSTVMWRIELGEAGLGVDLDDREVRPERVRRVRRLPVVLGGQPAVEALGRPRRVLGRLRELRPRDRRGRRAGHAEALARARPRCRPRRPRAGARPAGGPSRARRRSRSGPRVPPTCSEREPIVPMPRSTFAVSDCIDAHVGEPHAQACPRRAARRPSRGPGRARTCPRSP